MSVGLHLGPKSKLVLTAITKVQLFSTTWLLNDCLQSVPQISSVSAYNTQFKMSNTHRISFPGVSDTHVKFYFTFYIMRVIISPRETKHSWFSLPPLDCVEFHCVFFSVVTAPLDTMFTVSECKCLVYSTWVTSRAEQVYSAGLDILDIVRLKNKKYRKKNKDRIN